MVIDGNSVAHRAFHAWGTAGLTDSYGRPQEVCYGFLKLVGAACEKVRARHGQLDRLLVAFDSPVNHRRALDAGYKASRPRTDASLAGQLDRLRLLLDRAEIPWVCHEGWEGDDLLAAAARTARAAGDRCVLVTSDRDALALVADDVELLQLRNGMDRARFLDPAAVLQEYGVPPERYRLLAALRGDPSDDLPGVPGLGPKKAARLAELHPTLEAMLADPELGRLVGPKAAAALDAHQGAVRRNLELMSPRDDLAVPWSRVTLPSLAQLTGALATFELPGLVRSGVPVALAAGDAGTVGGVTIRRLE